MRSSWGVARRASTIGLQDLHDRFGVRQRLTDDQSLLDGNAEAPRDRQHRDRRCEVDVQLRPTVVDESVDEQVHGALDPVRDPPLRLGRHEGRLHECSVPPVTRPAHRQHAAGDADVVGVGPRSVGRRREHLIVAVRGVAGVEAERREVWPFRERQPVEEGVCGVARQLVHRALVHRRALAERAPDRVRIVGEVATREEVVAAAEVEEPPQLVAVERLGFVHAGHRATYPPSTGRSTPVTFAARSDTR